LLHHYWDLLLHYHQLTLAKLCHTPWHCCDVNISCFATLHTIATFYTNIMTSFAFFHPLCLCHILHQHCNALFRFYHIPHYNIANRSFDIDENITYYKNVLSSVGLVYRLYLDINLGINMKMLDQLGMVCSLYYSWDILPWYVKIGYFDSYQILLVTTF
jgi:hypothetical protein